MVRYIPNGGATKAAAITKDDTSDIPGGITTGIYIGGAGNLVVTLADDASPVTFTALAVGVVHPLRVKRVMAASTATNIVGIW